MQKEMAGSEIVLLRELRNTGHVCLRLHLRITNDRSGHEPGVHFVCQQRIRKLSEVRLEDGRDAADIIESLRVQEVEGSIIGALEQLRDRLRLPRAASLAIDTFEVQCYWVDTISVYSPRNSVISYRVCRQLLYTSQQ